MREINFLYFSVCSLIARAIYIHVLHLRTSGVGREMLDAFFTNIMQML